MYVLAVALRVLSWNLMHGRAQPPAGRDLLDEFAAVLAAWEWDIALLQEAPPWWPRALGERLGAEHRQVLTSRNALLPVRRAIAVRRPDLTRSNGGGANAILVRGAGPVHEHRSVRLAWWPERRSMHAVRLAGGTWVGNLHATVRDDARARSEAARAATTLLGWAGRAPAVLGGDFNVRGLALAEYERAVVHDVDMVFAHGLGAASAAGPLERGVLSDHAPVAVSLAAG